MRTRQKTDDIDYSKIITPEKALKFKKSLCFGLEYEPGDSVCNDCADQALCCIAFTQVLEAKQLELDSEFFRADITNISDEQINLFVEKIDGKTISRKKALSILQELTDIGDSYTLKCVLNNIIRDFSIKTKKQDSKIYLICE